MKAAAHKALPSFVGVLMLSACSGGSFSQAGDRKGSTSAVDAAPSPPPSPSPSLSQSPATDEQVAEPAQVAGAFLTCDQAPEFQPTSAGAPYGCAVTDGDHVKQSHAPSNPLVVAKHTDGSSTPLTVSTAPAQSRFHVYFYLTKATAPSIESISLTAANINADNPVTSPLVSPDASSLLASAGAKCGSGQIFAGAGCVTPTAINQWTSPHPVTGGGSAIPVPYLSLDSTGCLGLTAASACTDTNIVASSTFVGPAFQAVVISGTSPPSGDHYVPLTALEKSASSVLDAFLLANQSEVSSFEASGGFQLAGLGVLYTFPEGTPNTYPLYEWRGEPAGLGQSTHVYTPLCSCDQTVDLTSPDTTDVCTKDYFGIMNCTPVGSNVVLP